MNQEQYENLLAYVEENKAYYQHLLDKANHDKDYILTISQKPNSTLTDKRNERYQRLLESSAKQKETIGELGALKNNHAIYQIAIGSVGEHDDRPHTNTLSKEFILAMKDLMDRGDTLGVKALFLGFMRPATPAEGERYQNNIEEYIKGLLAKPMLLLLSPMYCENNDIFEQYYQHCLERNQAAEIISQLVNEKLHLLDIAVKQGSEFYLSQLINCAKEAFQEVPEGYLNWISNNFATQNNATDSQFIIHCIKKDKIKHLKLLFDNAAIQDAHGNFNFRVVLDWLHQPDVIHAMMDCPNVKIIDFLLTVFRAVGNSFYGLANIKPENNTWYGTNIAQHDIELPELNDNVYGLPLERLNTTAIYEHLKKLAIEPLRASKVAVQLLEAEQRVVLACESADILNAIKQELQNKFSGLEFNDFDCDGFSMKAYSRRKRNDLEHTLAIMEASLFQAQSFVTDGEQSYKHIEESVKNYRHEINQTWLNAQGWMVANTSEEVLVIHGSPALISACQAHLAHQANHHIECIRETDSYLIYTSVNINALKYWQADVLERFEKQEQVKTHADTKEPFRAEIKTLEHPIILSKSDKLKNQHEYLARSLDCIVPDRRTARKFCKLAITHWNNSRKKTSEKPSRAR